MSNIMFEDSLNTQHEETAPPLTLFCICCLSKEVPYVLLSTCSHSEFLNSFVKPEIQPRNQVVCYHCHIVLKKIKLFTAQVMNSFKLIAKKNIIQNVQQKNYNLQVQNQENINIPQTNINEDVNQTIDNKEVTHQTPEMSTEQKSLDTYERKMKNIGNALKIINNNQNSSCVNLLATSLNSISNSLINKTLDINNISILNNLITNSNISKVPISNNVIEEHMLVDGTQDNFNKKEEVKHSEKKNNQEVSRNIKKIVKSKRNVLKSSILSRIKTIILTTEEVMVERSKLATSLSYVKSLYKCETCLIGFNYEENLQDHVKRRHTNKENTIKCDVCQQIFNPGAGYDEHTAYHYTRYECLSCGLRFHSEDEIIFHYKRNHITSTKLKCLHCSYNMTSYRHIKSGTAVKLSNTFKKYKCLRCKKICKQNFVEKTSIADDATVELS